MRILEAYACAGHYGDGLADAGLRPYAIDNDPRALRHNPHPQLEMDALDALDRLIAGELLPFTHYAPGSAGTRCRVRPVSHVEWLGLDAFAAAHGSPPCQGHSATRELANAQGRGAGRAVDLIPATRDRFRQTGLPWVIENVYRSPLRHEPHTMLCGSAFYLEVERHRLFVTEGFDLEGTLCIHADAFPLDLGTLKPRPWGVYHTKGDSIPSGGRTVHTLEQGMRVMGITRRTPWKYLCEALPPAYGRHLGAQMLAQLSPAAEGIPA